MVFFSAPLWDHKNRSEHRQRQERMSILHYKLCMLLYSTVNELETKTQSPLMQIMLQIYVYLCFPYFLFPQSVWGLPLYCWMISGDWSPCDILSSIHDVCSKQHSQEAFLLPKMMTDWTLKNDDLCSMTLNLEVAFIAGQMNFQPYVWLILRRQINMYIFLSEI